MTAEKPSELPYKLEFYDEPGTGRMPVVEWMRSLDPYLRRAIGVALREVLQRYGVEVCKGEWGKQLGGGLFEFRVRRGADEVIAMFTDRTPRREAFRGKIALRVFVHPHGEKFLLLLGGYDKGVDPSERRQDEEIELARKRLREYRLRKGSRQDMGYSP